ncbi:MAG: hypothetical protein IKP72_04430 [Clostridia bacterium]|nr:hypothetical protein [Clostridia bacterium]
MNTVFPYKEQIDYEKYLDAYLQRDDAVRYVPTDAELKELARKAIVREQIVLLPLPAEEKARAGDTAVLKTESTLPKFNKDRVTVTLGRGLYSKELENSLIGKAAGETVSTVIQEQPVMAQILELKRKQIPGPTDEMVQALQAKDFQGRLITNVADYEAFIRTEKTNEVLATVNYYVMEEIIKAYPMTAYDEEDIRVLGRLERPVFAKLLREQGLDPEKEVPPEWEKDMNVHSLDEFISLRREWYQMKIQQCLIYLNILGLPCQGKTDPLDHYEVLSELMEKMFAKIKKDLERRKNG